MHCLRLARIQGAGRDALSEAGTDRSGGRFLKAYNGKKFEIAIRMRKLREKVGPTTKICGLETGEHISGGDTRLFSREKRMKARFQAT